MNKDRLIGVPYSKVPEGKRGNMKRRQGDDGRPMIQCRDWEGKWIWVKVPEITYEPIPESWTTFYWFIFATSNKPVAPNALRNEQCAVVEARALSLPAFAPVERKIIRKRDPKTGKRYRTGDNYDRLLFENYILVGFGRNDLWHFYDHRRKLMNCKHIMDCVTLNDKPIWVDSRAMCRLIEGINSGVYDESINNPEADDSIKVNDLVEIMGGPFDQFTGMVEKVFQKSDGKERWISGAKVELDILGHATPCSFPIDSLKRLGVVEEK